MRTSAGAGLRNWQLFAFALLVWGTTWHAIVYQLAHTSAPFGVALRFTLAGAVLLAYARWRGISLRLGARAHAWLAVQGLFMFSLSYLCTYSAVQHVPSGLVAVGYSASPLITGLCAWLLWRRTPTPRFVLGGVLGLIGVALIFQREFAQASASVGMLQGAMFTLAAVVLSAAGSLMATRNAGDGLALWPALGLSMLYSSVLSWIVAAVEGQAVPWPLPPSWWLSLAYLTLVGSALVFASYLVLQQRIGAGPASTVGAATPVLALAMSTAFEGYQPQALAIVGVVLAVAGNALALGWGARPSPASAPGPGP